MKKLSKSALIITVVTALLFAVAVTALAASWGDSGTFSGPAYSGDYFVTMSLTDDKASAVLEVSNYKGITQEGGGAQIVGIVRAGDNVSDPISTRVGENIYKASLTIDHNNFDTDRPYQELTCYYTFYEKTVTNHVLDNK